METIADKITPEDRRQIEKWKKLSVEELYVLKKRTALKGIIPTSLLFFLVFSPAVHSFVYAMESGYSFYVAGMVFVAKLYVPVFVALVFAILIYFTARLNDLLKEDYVGKSKNILKKLRKTK